MTLLLAALAIFLILGVPIAYSLGLAATCYFLIARPELLAVVPQRFFAGMDSYALVSLPLFILMGQLMNASGITSQLIALCELLVGRVRGGLGLVNVAASMLFGGISGSSASDTASIGAVLIPEMQRRGYPKDFAAGITVASSTMGMIIPPSVPMVIYAVTAQVSVGKLFLGGVVPGLLVGLFQLMLVAYVSRRRQFPVDHRSVSFGQACGQFARAIHVLLMPVVVVGSVVAGIATATESAAIGVFYALLVGLLVTRQLTCQRIGTALRSSVLISARIMMIIAFSQVFIWVLAYERVPQTVAQNVVALQLGPTTLMLIITAVVLAAGTFIDVSPAILLLTPVFLPAASQAGISPVLFGVVLVSGLAVGACTPPVGNCLNVCAAVADLRIGEIFTAAALFLLANVAVLVIVVILPDLVLWLPTRVFGL